MGPGKQIDKFGTGSVTSLEESISHPLDRFDHCRAARTNQCRGPQCEIGPRYAYHTTTVFVSKPESLRIQSAMHVFEIWQQKQNWS